jgi:transcriptional regulator with XRE-family HTH domain
MTAEQLRMARALLRIGVRELARLASVDKNTISALENGAKGHAATIARLKEALQERGVLLIPALEGIHGAAVSMRWGMEPPKGMRDDEQADEGEDDEGLQSSAWDDTEMLPVEEIDGLRRYWSEADRWEYLSSPSRKALGRMIGPLSG